MQRQESPANARYMAVQLHDFGCQCPAVRMGQLTLQNGSPSRTDLYASYSEALVTLGLGVEHRVRM